MDVSPLSEPQISEPGPASESEASCPKVGPRVAAASATATQTPFGKWLVERQAAGEPTLTTLGSIGVDAAAVCAFGEDVARERLQAFALHPQACEVIRKCLAAGSGAVPSARPPPFPFSVWLREREANGATAEQILRVLCLSPGQSSDMGEAQRWAGLWKLAEEDRAWEVLASMARPAPLAEAPPRKVRAVVDGTQEVAELIAQSSRILVLTGAGISASCGIPTFRDSGGFYESVAQEYGLSTPEQVSDINYFRKCPEPWFKKVQPIVPTTSAPRHPSLTHRFLRLLEDRGKLLHLFTQNIDTLETIAGITRVTFCHGSFGTATCMGCRRAVDGQATNEAISAGNIPRCTDCGDIVKPDVVLFNEPMPAGVGDLIVEHTEQADLLLVIGTSLNVTPCSLIPNLVGASGDAPRVLVNKEAAGKTGDFEGFLQGSCDEIVQELLCCLGWRCSAEEAD